MDQKTLARWLKAVIIGTGICGLVVFLWLVPFMGKGVLEGYPESGPHLRFQDRGRSFELYTVSRDNLEDLPRRLPGNTLCQWSGNNSSGAVVTIWRDAL